MYDDKCITADMCSILFYDHVELIANPDSETLATVPTVCACKDGYEWDTFSEECKGCEVDECAVCEEILPSEPNAPQVCDTCNEGYFVVDADGTC